MKIKKGNAGFTLIELLIGINLAFILITLLVSFYLFSAKFVSVASRNMESKEMLLSSVGKFQELIKKKAGFSIRRGAEKEILFIFEPKDTVSLRQNSFGFSGFYSGVKIDDYSLKISMSNGRELKLNDNDSLQEDSPVEEYISKDIDSVVLEIKMNRHEYTFHLLKNRTSENSFKDIEK